MISTQSAPKQVRVERRKRAKGFETRQALLDAAEKVLIEEGYTAVTSRRVAAVSGQNAALVYYHFENVQDLLFAVIDRVTDEAEERLNALYSSGAPLVSNWRAHTNALFGDDFQRGYPKVWFEFAAFTMNNPEFREKLAPRLVANRQMLANALRREFEKHGMDPALQPIGAISALFHTVLEGLLIERIVGHDDGHRELLQFIEDYLVSTFGQPGAAFPSSNQTRDKSQNRSGPRR